MLDEIHVKRQIQQGFSLSWAPKNIAPLSFDEILGGINGGSLWLPAQHYSKAIYSANWNYKNMTFLYWGLCIHTKGTFSSWTLWSKWKHACVKIVKRFYIKLYLKKNPNQNKVLQNLLKSILESTQEDVATCKSHHLYECPSVSELLQVVYTTLRSSLCVGKMMLLISREIPVRTLTLKAKRVRLKLKGHTVRQLFRNCIIKR